MSHEGTTRATVNKKLYSDTLDTYMRLLVENGHIYRKLKETGIDNAPAYTLLPKSNTRVIPQLLYSSYIPQY